MQIKITSKQSIYLEVAEKLETLIRLGVYKENEQLPSCRKLGLELGVNPNTIERAYSLLEEKKVIYTIPKKGMFVCALETESQMLDEVEKTIRHFREIGIQREKVEELLKKIYEEENYD